MGTNTTKKRGIGKLCAAILCFALVFCGGFGQMGALLAATDTATIDTQEQRAINEAKKELITLEQVRNESRSRGTETKDARSGLVTAQAAKDAADMTLYDAIYIGMDEAIVRAVLNQESAGTSLEDAKATLETQMEAAIYSGERLFFEYLQLLDSLTSLEATIDLSKEQLRIEELKARIGLSTDTEVKKKALALDNLVERRESLVSGIDLKGRTLLLQMGRDPDLVFRLDPAFSIEGLRTVYDPEQLADLAVKNNLTLGVLRRNIDKLGDTLFSSFSVLSSTDRGVYGAQRDSLILSRDRMIDELKLAARNTATGLTSARVELELLGLAVAEKQVDYEVIALQVSIGLAPKIALSAAELDLLSAQNALAAAQQNYYLSLRRASLLLNGIALR